MGTLDVHSTRGRHELRSRVQNELGLQGSGSPSSLNKNWYENHRQNRQTMHFTWKSSTKQTNNALKVKGLDWGVKAWKSTDADAYFLLILIVYPTKNTSFSPKIANIFTRWAESTSGIGLCLSVRPSSLRSWSLSLLLGLHPYNHTFS